MDTTQEELDALLAHREFVRALASRLLRDASGADDVAQDTWVAALRARPSERGSLRPWLARVAQRFALQERRQRAHREVREARGARRGAVASTDEIVAREEERHRLVRAVLELPSASREVVLLRYFEGLPPREIAAHLGVPVDTVKSRLKRGLAALRDQLTDPRREGARARSLAGLALLARDHVAPTTATILMAKTHKTAALVALLLATAGLIGWGALAPRGERDAARGTAAAPPTLERPASSAVEPDAPNERQALAAPERVHAPAPEPELVPEASGATLVRGHVLTETGDPIVGAEVRGWCAEEPDGEPHGVVRTDGLGAFALPHMGRALYLEASSGDDQPLRVVSGVLPDVDEAEGFVLLVAQARNVSGFVRSTDRAPLPGARVHARGPGPHGDAMTPVLGVYNQRPDSPTVVTGASGAFQLTHFAGPRPSLHVAREGYQPQTRTLAEDEETVELLLEPAFELTGRVVSDAGPVAGAVVTLHARSELARTTTDATGAFALRDLEPERRCWLGVHAKGYAIQGVWPLAVPRTDSRPVDVRLEPGNALRGRVVWKDGSPAYGVTVRIAGDERLQRDFQWSIHDEPTLEGALLPSVESSTDAAGGFAFDDLYSGRFRIDVRYGEDPVRVQEFEWTSGPEECELVLDPDLVHDVVFEGIVRDALTRQPVTAFDILILGTREDGSEFNTRPVRVESDEGRYRLDGHGQAMMRLFVTAPGYARGTSDYKEWAPGVYTVDVELPPVRSLHARFVTSSGEPLHGATILVSTPSGSYWVPTSARARGNNLRTDERGEAFLHELPAGPISLWVGLDDESWRFEIDVTEPHEGAREFRVERDGE